MEQREFMRYFDKRLFIPTLKSKTKDNVFGEMVEHITKLTPLKDQQLILEMLNRREQLGSTGIGHGIAIPHGRSISAPNLMVTFGKSKKGIKYESMDNEPVYLIFMIIAPPQEQSIVYLPFLGKLVDIIKNEEIREQLKKAETFKDFIDALSGGF